MIKLVLKYLIYTILFVMTLVYFLPKENMFYLLEKKLFENKIIISNEKITEKSFSTLIDDSDVYYNNLKFSKVNNIDISTYIFVNNIKITHVKISDDFKNFLPQNIKYININHSILNPTNLEIDSKGEFGELSGIVNLINRRITVTLNASNQMKNRYKIVLNRMKLKEGKYTYEYKF